jgi:hypothetical protein
MSEFFKNYPFDGKNLKSKPKKIRQEDGYSVDLSPMTPEQCERAKTAFKNATFKDDSVVIVCKDTPE